MFSIVVLASAVVVTLLLTEAYNFYPNDYASYNLIEQNDFRRTPPRRHQWRPTQSSRQQDTDPQEYFKLYAINFGRLLGRVFPKTVLTLPVIKLRFWGKNLNLTNYLIESDIKFNLKSFHTTPMKHLKTVKARAEYLVPLITFRFKFNYFTSMTCAKGRLKFIVHDARVVVYFTANQTTGCYGKSPVHVEGINAIREDEIFQLSRIEFEKMKINRVCKAVTRNYLREFVTNRTKEAKTIEKSVSLYFGGHKQYPEPVNDVLVEVICKKVCFHGDIMVEGKKCNECKAKFCTNLLSLIS